MWVAIGSLGGALVGVIGSLTLWFASARRAGKGAEQDRRQRAYSDLLVASLGVTLRAQVMITVLKTRSGLGEGVAVMLGQRKQLDAMELHDWVNQDFGALTDAWSRAWSYGTAAGVALANSLVDACGQVVEVVTLADAQGRWDKARQAMVGVDIGRLTTQWDERMKLVAVARRDLAQHLRSETGREAAELFGTGERALG